VGAFAVKQAATTDVWRRLAGRSPKCHIQSFGGDAAPNFPPEAILVHGAVTAITGLNGVGKSTLLRAAYLLLARDEKIAVDIVALKEYGGDLSAEILEKGVATKIHATLAGGIVKCSPAALETNVTWIDPAFEVPALIKEFRDEKNLSEVLEQVESSSASAEELEEISWVVGKIYDSCDTYELEDFGGREVTPYFRVRSGGLEYGTEGMGLGEASLHYIMWNLKRMPESSVVLIEEPETYISARSQGALVDTLADTCAKRNGSALLTTHSAQVFAKIPPEHTIILLKKGNETRVVVKDTDAARLMALGVPPVEEKAGVLLVEDRMARELAWVWLARVRPELLRSWRILDVGSTGEVIKTLNHFPKLEPWFRAIGLLDGDESKNKHETTGRVSFLPGEQPPEVLLKSAILERPDEIANILRIDTDAVRIATSAIGGLDHHDWFLDLSNYLKSSGVIFRDLVASSFDVWMSIGSNSDTSAKAFDELIAYMTSK
jgi:ABC-type cobalamin/Fe3+-siderophores transport system ATPase subunit